MRLRALIPVAAATMLSAPAAASAAFPHVVAPGESLSSVAASDGLTVDQLALANGLSPDTSLVAGSTLMIPSALQCFSSQRFPYKRRPAVPDHAVAYFTRPYEAFLL
jgi:LysM repeat protein